MPGGRPREAARRGVSRGAQGAGAALRRRGALHAVRLHARALRTSKAIANFHAGPPR